MMEKPTSAKTDHYLLDERIEMDGSMQISSHFLGIFRFLLLTFALVPIAIADDSESISAVLNWQADTWKLPRLPDPSGRTIPVTPDDDIEQIIENAGNDVTILLADGDYRVTRHINLRGRKHVTIRSVSNDPRKVVIRGLGWDTKSDQDDILRIGNCENILVARLTFADCHSYAVKIEAENHPRDIHIFNCHFRNIGMRAIKGSGGDGLADRGTIRYCHFENTKIPPSDWLFDGNYITAIDMMALKDWTISNNVFVNIKGRTGSARAAIFVWVRSRDVMVEKNLFVGCDRGVAFGNPSASTSHVAGNEHHVKNSVCRNNFIVPGPDAGIELWWVDNIQVYNNTIWRHDVEGRGIRFGARNSRITIANNLVRGTILQEDAEKQQSIRIVNNVKGNLDDYFLDPARGDLHLTSRARLAIDAAIELTAPDDFDGIRRDTQPDIGADELNSVAKQ